jgi:hypothetical protein
VGDDDPCLVDGAVRGRRRGGFFPSQIQHRSTSPDGLWTVYITRNHGMDNMGQYYLHIQPANDPSQRRELGHSHSMKADEVLSIIWSGTTSSFTVHIGDETFTYPLATSQQPLQSPHAH